MRNYCLSEEDLAYACAELTFAKKIGLIEEDGLDALEKRMIAHNARICQKIVEGELIYGVERFTAAAYLQYERTRFRLDFAEQRECIRKNYHYCEISEEEKRAFFEENRDLFTRYSGDSFTYEDVELIIEKRVRELEYDKNIKDILRQQS